MTLGGDFILNLGMSLLIYHRGVYLLITFKQGNWHER